MKTFTLLKSLNKSYTKYNFFTTILLLLYTSSFAQIIMNTPTLTPARWEAKVELLPVDNIGGGTKFIRTPILFTNPDTTRVGIGTDKPMGKIDIRGPIRFSDQSNIVSWQFKVEHSATVGPYMTFRNTNADIFGSKNFAFLTAGNIGVGIDIPESKLDVNGDLKIRGNVNANNLSLAGNINANSLSLTNGITATNLSLSNNLTTNNLTVTGNFSASNLSLTGNINANNLSLTGSINAYALSLTGDITATNLSLSNNLTTKNLFVTEDFVAINLSLANNLTTKNLSVTGNLVAINAGFSGNISGNTLNINTASFGSINANSLALTDGITATNLSLSNNLTTNNLTVTGNFSAGNVNFSGNITGNSLNITGNGTFGSLSSSSFTLADGTQGNGKVLVSNATGVASWQNITSSGWTISGNNIYRNTGANGKVGIGTNDPQKVLHIYTAHSATTGGGGGGGGSDTDNPTGSHHGIRLENHGFLTDLSLSSVWDIEPELGVQNSKLSFKNVTNDKVVLTLADTGNVGIGTSDPGAKLEVNSGGSDLSPIIAISTPSAADFISLFGGRQNNQNPFISWKRGPLRFATANTFGGGDFSEKMRITESGNVLIGSTTDDTDFKLQINGKLKARGVKITDIGWSDYILSPSYKRMSFIEKEQYIKAHGHLEGIDSWKEIEENGLDLNKNLPGMTKNIEENTLDIIDLYKATLILQEENKALRNEITDLKKKL